MTGQIRHRQGGLSNIQKDGIECQQQGGVSKVDCSSSLYKGLKCLKSLPVKNIFKPTNMAVHLLRNGDSDVSFQPISQFLDSSRIFQHNSAPQQRHSTTGTRRSLRDLHCKPPKYKAPPGGLGLAPKCKAWGLYIWGGFPPPPSCDHQWRGPARNLGGNCGLTTLNPSKSCG